MIKRMFRKHLRKSLMEDFGASCPEFEEIFQWVYEAPILEWKIRKYCVFKTIEWFEPKDGYFRPGETDHVIRLDKAKELLWFLSK